VDRLLPSDGSAPAPDFPGKGPHLLFVLDDMAGVAGALADHGARNLVSDAGLEPRRSVVDVQDGDHDGGGGIEGNTGQHRVL